MEHRDPAITSVGALLAGSALLLLVACAGTDRQQSASGTQSWWGETYSSTSVTGGDGAWMSTGSDIRLWFDARDGDGRINWSAGCNTWEAPVAIGSERLRVDGDWESTLMGCGDAQQRQDERIRDLFSSNPTWDRENGRLRLTDGDVVIHFEPAPQDPEATEDPFTGVSTQTG